MEKIQIEQHTFMGDRVGRRMDLHDRVPSPRFLERCCCNCAVALLPRHHLQLVGALMTKHIHSPLAMGWRPALSTNVFPSSPILPNSSSLLPASSRPSECPGSSHPA